MLAWRTTWQVKQGKMEEAAKWVYDKWAYVMSLAQGAHNKGCVIRIYSPDLSPHVLVFEESWDTEADQSAFWKEFQAKPEYTAAMAESKDLFERALGTEPWIVTEIR